MNWESDLDRSLGGAVGIGATVVAAVSAAVLVTAVLAEIFAALGKAPRLVAAMRQATPTSARRVAALAVGLVMAVHVSPRPAIASENAPSVREWLNEGDQPSVSPDEIVPSDVAPIELAPKEETPAPLTASMPTLEDLPTPQGESTASTQPSAREIATAPAAVTTVRSNPVPSSQIPLNQVPVNQVPSNSAPSTTVGVGTYTVKSGDCLWSIAADQLGSGSSNIEIDRAWRAIYQANQQAVGEDPGLIHPGLVLSLPPQ